MPMQLCSSPPTATDCIAILNVLKSPNPCPTPMALVTGIGGSDGERDMVIEIDRWQRE